MYINCKIVHVCANLGIIVGGGGGGGGQREKEDIPQQRGKSGKSQARIQRGGRGAGVSGPPWKITNSMGFYRE